MREWENSLKLAPPSHDSGAVSRELTETGEAGMRMRPRPCWTIQHKDRLSLNLQVCKKGQIK